MMPTNAMVATGLAVMGAACFGVLALSAQALFYGPPGAQWLWWVVKACFVAECALVALFFALVADRMLRQAEQRKGER